MKITDESVTINVALPPREVTTETICKDIKSLLKSERKYLESLEDGLSLAKQRCIRLGFMLDDYDVNSNTKVYENIWNEKIAESKTIVNKLEKCINILNDNN